MVETISVPVGCIFLAFGTLAICLKMSIVSEYCLGVKAIKTQDCTSIRKVPLTPGTLCKTDNTLQFRAQMKKYMATAGGGGGDLSVS